MGLRYFCSLTGILCIELKTPTACSRRREEAEHNQLRRGRLRTSAATARVKCLG